MYLVHTLVSTSSGILNTLLISAITWPEWCLQKLHKVNMINMMTMIDGLLERPRLWNALHSPYFNSTKWLAMHLPPPPPNKVCWNKQLFICSPVTVNFQIKKWNFRLISNFARDFNRYQDGFTLRAWTLKIPISNKLVRVLHDEKDGHICTQVFFWLVPSGESLQKSSWNLRNKWKTL